MSKKTPIHRPYSFKKEVLDAWKDARKEEGMTKVKFSRMRRVTISTFDKWLAKADEIAKVENGSSKHVRGRSMRGVYSKERPSDEKKGQLYDWLKAALKPVNQADLRKEARRIWPEWCDMDHDEWKTPGNIRKFCSRFAERYFPTATDQHAEQHVDQLTAQSAEQLTDQQAVQETDHQGEQHDDQLISQQSDQHADEPTDQQDRQHVDQLTDQQDGHQIVELVGHQAHQQVDELTDQQARQFVDQLTDHQDGQHVDQLTDQQDGQHVDQLTDQQDGQHIAELVDHQAHEHVDQLTDQQAHEHVDQLTDQQTETPFNQRTFGDILDEYPPNSDGVDVNKRKRPRSNNDYESADENEYGKGYIHIDESMPLRGRTSKARPARLARYSSGSKYNSGIHNDRCYRCNRRSPCTDWRKCSNLDSRHECASDRCSAGKHCQNNAIQQKRFPKTTVVVDPTFGFGLRLDESVPKDTKIIEYVGQLITKESYLCRKEKGRGQLAWYIARVSREDDNLYVDATKYGNAARFINHSCLPNCRFETWYVDKKPRLMVVSRLPLEKGCILSLHYMDSTWGTVCQCGFCDGTYLPIPTELIDD
ncbi:hypothetical protein AeMF1_020277 [Aphanomyces euteiches]|nr:hypothetical protein AeMF1_020277 [Aphanomyces euteiches]KAH9188722.1 hypothetical protein AeNC1_009304 [Aphanomyces euteiches]